MTSTSSCDFTMWQIFAL